MRAKGNGEVAVTSENLLAIVRGEVPFDRLRGIGTEPIDKPADVAASELEQDALWVLETYEPRAEVNGVTVTQEEGHSGAFKLTADIT